MSKKDWSHETYTTENTVISADFLVWKFCGKAQFPHSFGRIAIIPHQEIRWSHGIFCSVH